MCRVNQDLNKQNKKKFSSDTPIVCCKWPTCFQSLLCCVCLRSSYCNKKEIISLSYLGTKRNYEEMFVLKFRFVIFFLKDRIRLTLEDHYKTIEDLFCFYPFHPHIKMGFFLLSVHLLSVADL